MFYKFYKKIEIEIVNRFQLSKVFKGLLVTFLSTSLKNEQLL